MFVFQLLEKATRNGPERTGAAVAQPFDLRSARVRALLHVMLELNPMSSTRTPLPEPRDSLGRHGPNMMGYVLANVSRAAGSSPANRIFRDDMNERGKAPSPLVEGGAAVQSR